jgi:glycosyltransferase involved in cell wall biosynthesis
LVVVGFDVDMKRASARRRVLVISQRSDRTGAPIQLCVLLEGLEKQLGASVTLLLGSSGPLTAAFGGRVSSLKTEPWPLRVLSRAGRRMPRGIQRRVDRLWAFAMRRHVGSHDLVYVNSLSSRRLAAPFTCWPMVVHVHEIGTFADQSGAEGRDMITNARRVLVPSRAAKSWVRSVGIPAEAITRIPGTLPDSAFEAPEWSDVERLRSRLGFPPDALVVMSVGWIGEMKGSDRFLEVARHLVDSNEGSTVRMVWVGGDLSTRAGVRFAGDIERLGLSDVVVMAPDLDDLRAMYLLSTFVLISSREESLSLVALEAAAQRTPVVAFPGAGGPDELAEEGVVALSLSPHPLEMAKLINRLHRSVSSLEAQSEAALQAVTSGHRREQGQDSLVQCLRSELETS